MARKKHVDTTRHKDKRVNIPTNELRGFVSEDEESPDIMLYPRDPSLDPQLVWQGKDEQDSEDLAVPIVPIYIQEKIHPQAIIEEVKRQAKADAPMQQMSLFDDFNGIDFEQLIEFYEHEQNWSNRMILGDSLQVMTSLAEKEGLKGKVQMVYLDPPYGIKFGSNWQVSTRKRNVTDGRDTDLTRQPEQIRAFRDTWEKGLHSYLAYLRDRLVVSRELLNDSGSIFVQIGVDNVHLIRNILDEVFGSENFLSLISFQKTGGLVSRGLVRTVDYLCWYAKDSENVKIRQLYNFRSAGDTSLDRYDLLMDENNSIRRLTDLEKYTGDLPQNTKRFRYTAIESANPTFDFEFHGKTYTQKWKTNLTGLERLRKANRLVSTGTKVNYVRFVDDFPVIPLTDRWESMQIGTGLTYVVQTSTKVTEKCMLMTTDPGDIVLDPTMGSGTTAYTAEEWGRRWITIDTSRVAVALARTRLMSARYPYYTLSDSPSGDEMEAGLTGMLPGRRSNGFDIRKGFVYKRSPHIMLSDISRNEEIDEIYERWQAQIEPVRHQINDLLNVEWEEWEVPREIDENWQSKVKDLLFEYWELRQARQAEINKSIERNSEFEILYDQPYEDNSKVRVTGAFTVESLSPHRFITDEDQLRKQASDPSAVSDYEEMILENLLQSGVQNTIKQERLVFENIEPYASTHIQAVGNYTDGEGNARRAAIYIGSEHGTVSPQQVNDAAKEAVKGIGFDVLIICGFAFDPHVSVEATRYGKLQVLITRMNPDLAMGADLKTTKTGNLFMVFGEPDIEIRDADNGQKEVELFGLDVYDPTTGELRPRSTDDIACWFIDTDYDEESLLRSSCLLHGCR